eukprot:CAMPEP_0198362042 /NCGR_PEP_ID=MMETSP1450-20131203/144518_1 /TAXON_ID=753684 ORGANISM="Madagascaria erythrocladiodes, Strain CCMP3234" /NCGR_SAMPLE_ID=MMETSP1450 /ASSEMBLY_ACC=CAM_ASM_001115 /LENGTH=38 /DNA_ID= /DNA_START= /DNA_END= /DNA_ORIENTATION=
MTEKTAVMNPRPKKRSVFLELEKSVETRAEMKSARKKA